MPSDDSHLLSPVSRRRRRDSIPCGICGRQSDTGTDFTERNAAFPLTIILPVFPTHLLSFFITHVLQS